MRSGRKKAFTLVEVLVSIAVIMALTAIALPIIVSSREMVRKVACSNNLRQWGLALHMYMTDHGGYIPRRGQGVRELRVIDRSSDWFNCLPPYFGQPSYCELVKEGRAPRPGDRSVFVCPSADDPGGKYFLSYGMNMYLSPWVRPDPHNGDEIKHACQIVFMADGPGAYSSVVPSRKGYNVSARHGGCANVLFLDGHVEAFTGEYLGCGVGDTHRPDVRWETGTDGINQEPLD